MFLNLMVSALNFLRKRTFVISITIIGPKIYCYSVVLLCTCSEKQISSFLKKTLLTLRNTFVMSQHDDQSAGSDCLSWYGASVTARQAQLL